MCEREGKDGEVLESHREATWSLQQIDSMTLKLKVPLDGLWRDFTRKEEKWLWFLVSGQITHLD